MKDAMLNTDDKNQDLAAAATASLRLTAGENPDAVAVALQKSKELGIPYIWAREMDNADLQPDVTAEGLNPRLQRVLAENVDRAPIYRGNLPALDRAANVLDDIELSPLERYEKLSRERGPEGLQMLNAQDWAKLGYRLMPSGELVKHGQTAPPPVRLGDIVSGDEERALVDRTLEALKKSTGFDLSDWESFLVMSQAGKKEVLGGFIAQVERENALLRQLNADYPEGWIDKSDQGVRERIASIEKRFNVDLSDISIDRLRKGGLMEVDYLEAANLFGVRDIFKLATRMSPEELASVNADSPIGDQLAKLRHLSEQSIALRGFDLAGKVATGVVNMIPYMAEFALTSGIATTGKVGVGTAVKTALRQGGFTSVREGAKALFTKQGAKAIGQAVKAIATGEAKRLPFYAPRNVAQSYSELHSGPVYFFEEGGVKTVVPEATVGEMFTLIARKTLATYLGNASEWADAFIPGVDLTKLVPERMYPKGLQAKVVQRFLSDISGDATKQAALKRSLADSVPLGGVLGEVVEEWVDNAFNRASTLAGQATATEFLDMGRDSVFGDAEENTAILLTSIIGSTGGKMARLPSAVKHYHDLTRFVDGHRKLVSAVQDLSGKLPGGVGEAETFLNLTRNGDAYMLIDPDDAEAFYQTNRTFAEAVGVTEKAISEARDEGRLLVVYQNKMAAEQAKSPDGEAAGEALLSITQQAGVTVDEARTADIAGEAVDAYKQQQERLKGFRLKIQTAIRAAAKEAGISVRAQDAFAAMAAFQVSYLDQHSTEDGLIDKALDALIVDFQQDPGKYESAESLAQAEPADLQAMDDEYFDAIENEDDDKQAAMVEAAANKAGYVLGPVYHWGSFDKSSDIPSGPMHFGTEAAAEARAFGKVVDDFLEEVEAYEGDDGRWHWYDGTAQTSEDLGYEGFDSEEEALEAGKDYIADTINLDGADAFEGGNMTVAYLKADNLKRVKDAGTPDKWEKVVEKAKAQGYDGLVYRNEFEDAGKDSYIVFRPEQIKSAEPVEFDGPDIIPLSQRFDSTNPDVRYQSSPAAELDKEYLEAVKAGDMETVQRLVDDAAEKAGVPIIDDSEATAFQVRRGSPPKKTIKAYKLVRTMPSRKGEIFPLFVGASTSIPMGVWLDAIPGESAPPTKTGVPQVKSRLGGLSFRPGWHAGDAPLAAHIGTPSGGEGPYKFVRKPTEVWVEVEMAADTDYQDEANANGMGANGVIRDGLADIKHMPDDGFYRYKTNPNMLGKWIISGSMKVNRVMTETEVNAELNKQGLLPMPWKGGSLDLSNTGLSTETVLPGNTGKILDPVTYDDKGNVIPLAQRFDTSKADPRYQSSPTAELDGKYLEAVKAGDMETAQRMVDEAAEKAGYASGPVYHGTREAFTSFSREKIGSANDEGFLGRGFYFTSDKVYAYQYAGEGGRVINAYLRAERPYSMSSEEINVMADASDGGEVSVIEEFTRNIRGEGYDSVVYDDQIMIIDPEQAKSADPVTYDDKGNVIPLSQRFDTSKADLRYQGEGQYRGRFAPAADFNQSFNALITLFKGADASTLPHESAHWVKQMMEAMVANGQADETMANDLATIEAWLDRQEYTPEIGTPDYHRERAEKFARGFEEYIRTGKPPAGGPADAFATLKRLLVSIYRYVTSLGVKLDDEIVSVFDRMISSELAATREAPMLEAIETLKSTFDSLLGLSQPEAKEFIDLVRKARNQTIDTADAEKAKLLKKKKTEWAKEARAVMKDMKVYNAWADLKAEGGLDYAFIAESPDYGKEIADYFRKLGLTSPMKKPGKDVPLFAEKHGYASVDELLSDLMAAKSPQEFVKDYLLQQERDFNDGYELSDAAMTTQANVELLEKLAEALAVKAGREGAVLKRRALASRVQEKLGETRVKDIVSDSDLVKALRNSGKRLVKALNKQDYNTALELLAGIRFNVEMIRARSEAKRLINRTENLVKRARSAKKGAIFGDHHQAIQELAYYFGFSKSEVTWRENYRHRVGSNDFEGETFGDPFGWPEFLLTQRVERYQDLTYADFTVLREFAQFLNGEGRNLVKARKGTFANKVATRVEHALEVLSKQKAKYHDRKTETPFAVKASRTFANWGKNLATFFGKADGWTHVGGDRVRGPNIQLRDILVSAYGRMIYLENGAKTPCREALLALVESTRGMDLLQGLPKFGGNGALHGYSKWTPEMVVAACLNMGTASGRQRLMEGYQWSEADLGEIAAKLTAADWKHIQRIWDTLSGDLWRAVADTFLEENHYHLNQVDPLEFEVQTADGQVSVMPGGYYPIRYADRSKGKDIALGFQARKLHADVSSIKRRAETIKQPDPVKLELGVLLSHIHESAHYAATRMANREVLGVVMDPEYRNAFGTTQSFEAYDAMMSILKNAANPAPSTEGITRGFEGWARTVLTSTALMMNPRSTLMQFSSVTIGMQELGSYYADALAEFAQGPLEMRASVLRMSALMRHRADYFDIDLKEATNRFDTNLMAKAKKGFAKVGYAAMRGADTLVATIAWKAKYEQAMAELIRTMDPGRASIEAVARADDFVARTQGAARTIDLTPIQLDQLGRMMSTFITSTNAQYNTLLETIGATRAGVLSPGEAFQALAGNLVAPALLGAVIAWVVAGGLMGDDDDDPDRANRYFLQELISNPFAGIPVARDLVDLASTMVASKITGDKINVFGYNALDAGAVSAASDVFTTLAKGTDALSERDWSRAAWLWADAIGRATHTPAIHIYERSKRLFEQNGGDLPEVLKDLDKAVKPKEKK